MSAVKQILGMVLGHVVANKLAGSGLKAIEPGRYPQTEAGALVVPKGAEIVSIAQELKRASEQNLALAQQIERLAMLEAGDPARGPAAQVKLTPWAIYLGLAALAWYAWRASASHLAGDDELFPGLRRELHMEPEDPATSDDPVEVCLERRYGWNLKTMRDLRDSIAAKGTPDMFSEEQEELTGPEAQLLDQIEDCLDRLERQYGSLEDAGLEMGMEMIPCGACSETDGEAESSPQ